MHESAGVKLSVCCVYLAISYMIPGFGFHWCGQIQNFGMGLFFITDLATLTLMFFCLTSKEIRLCTGPLPFLSTSLLLHSLLLQAVYKRNC